MEPTLKAPRTKRLKLQCEILVPSFAFKFNLRRYMKVVEGFLSSVDRVVTMAHVATAVQHAKPGTNHEMLLMYAECTVRAMFDPDNGSVPWQGGC